MLNPFLTDALLLDLPDHPCLQGRGDRQGFVHVISKHPRGQAVVCGVGPLDDFLDAPETHDLLHWAEDLSTSGWKGAVVTGLS